MCTYRCLEGKIFFLSERITFLRHQLFYFTHLGSESSHLRKYICDEWVSELFSLVTHGPFGPDTENPENQFFHFFAYIPWVDPAHLRGFSSALGPYKSPQRWAGSAHGMYAKKIKNQIFQVFCDFWVSSQKSGQKSTLTHSPHIYIVRYELSDP